MTKSGGRKINAIHTGNNVQPGVGGGAVVINHQMRYRQQKTSSVNEGGGSTIDNQEFNTITDPLMDPGVQMSIRSKKNQQYVSLNAT